MEKDDDGSDIRCRLCGGGDETAENAIIICGDERGSGCSAAYHQRCLARPLRHVPTRAWHCPRCVSRARAMRCEVCASGDDTPANRLVLCGDGRAYSRVGCHRAFHQKCLAPTLARLPDADWYCATCTRLTGCADADAGCVAGADAPLARCAFCERTWHAACAARRYARGVRALAGGGAAITSCAACHDWPSFVIHPYARLSAACDAFVAWSDPPTWRGIAYYATDAARLGDLARTRAATLTERGARRIDVALDAPIVDALDARCAPFAEIASAIRATHRCANLMRWHLMFCYPGCRDQPMHVDHASARCYITYIVALTRDAPAAGGTSFAHPRGHEVVVNEHGRIVAFAGNVRHFGAGNQSAHARVFLYAAGVSRREDENEA